MTEPAFYAAGLRPRSCILSVKPSPETKAARWVEAKEGSG